MPAASQQALTGSGTYNSTVVFSNQNRRRAGSCFTIAGRVAQFRMLDIHPHTFTIRCCGYTGDFRTLLAQPENASFEHRQGRSTASGWCPMLKLRSSSSP